MNVAFSNALRSEALDHLIWPIIDAADVRRDGPMMIGAGKGMTMSLMDGTPLLDMSSGFTRANSLGYGNEEIVDAVAAQLKQMHYAGTVSMVTEPMIRLAARIAELTPGDLSYCFFVSGGSEAVESAVKIARQYQQANGKPHAYKILARWNAYHGATAGAMSLTDHLTVKDAPDPRMPGVTKIPNPMTYRNAFGMPEDEYMEFCADYLEQTILHEGPETVAAFIGEPVMQANGAQVPYASYWKKVREICDRYGVLLIIDEVICGFGRTGKWFAAEHFDVVADITTMAKAMTAGYMPMGAAVARKHIVEGIPHFRHVHTYTGHAGCAAAANAVIEIKEREGLIPRSFEMGEAFKAMMTEAFGDHPAVGEIRGLGNWTAVDFTADRATHAVPDPSFAKGVAARMKADGILISAAGTAVEIAPPLIATEEDYRQTTTALKTAIEAQARQGL